MKTFFVFTVSLALAGSLLLAQSDRSAEAALKAADYKAQIEGDLKGAIDQYKKITQSKDRSLAARAWIRMAESYQKLGSAQAHAIYERVVHDYADQQKERAQALARLGNNGNRADSGEGIATREVWTGPKTDVEGSVSADGRYVSFIDWDTGDVAIHDLMSGEDRRLTNKGSWSQSPDNAEETAISRDDKQVAYVWHNGTDNHLELRLIPVNQDSPAEPRVLYNDGTYTAPYDWSPDGKWIAVASFREGSVGIGLVNSRDGHIRLLKTVEWRGVGKLFFSPDGRYLAYDVPASADTRQRDVYVLAIDGSREIPAVVHPAMDRALGWSPDGNSLLFNSDRSGSPSLWALPFIDGKPHGDPELLKQDLGWVNPMGIAQSGSFYFGHSGRVRGTSEIAIATLDIEHAGLVKSSGMGSLGPVGIFPTWSPDGKSIAYIRELYAKEPTLIIQSLETGNVRQLSPDMTYTSGLQWAPDGNSVIVHGQDLKGKGGFYEVDAQTGNMELLFRGGLRYPTLDGQKFYVFNGDRFQTQFRLLERDLASGSPRIVLQSEALRVSKSVSPDRRYFAFIEPTSTDPVLKVGSTDGGETRELFRIPEANVKTFTEWTPDSKFILFPHENALWMVPSNGGEARKIEGTNGTRLEFRPGTNDVAYMRPSAKPFQSLWVMENFLTSSSK